MNGISPEVQSIIIGAVGDARPVGEIIRDEIKESVCDPCYWLGKSFVSHTFPLCMKLKVFTSLQKIGKEGSS